MSIAEQLAGLVQRKEAVLVAEATLRHEINASFGATGAQQAGWVGPRESDQASNATVASVCVCGLLIPDSFVGLFVCGARCSLAQLIQS